MRWSMLKTDRLAEVLARGIPLSTKRRITGVETE
jgi:hypothetical protein